MRMAFGVAAGVDKSRFAAGQKLAFDFAVRWNQRPALLIVSAQPLPANTALELSEE